MQTDARVDAYIARAQEFARPMLQSLREQAHATCPEAEETIKWGAPSLSYRSKNLCGLTGFKSHVAFFMQGERKEEGAEGMGEFGMMRAMGDLPTKAALAKLLKARMKVIEAGSTAPVGRRNRRQKYLPISRRPSRPQSQRRRLQGPFAHEPA